MIYDASTGKMRFSGGGPVPQLELEKVLVFKYLGIPLGVTSIFMCMFMPRTASFRLNPILIVWDGIHL